MARVTAAQLRTAAREAIFAAGGRGFVRFLPPGGALLATDANRRCQSEDEKQALIAALAAAGFACDEQSGLLAITPDDALLGVIGYGEETTVDWRSPLHPLQALGLRWLGKPKRTLTQDGRQLILETLRISWQQTEQVQGGAQALRAQAAMMQRRGDESGMHESGAVLLEWCRQTQGGNIDEA